MNMKKVFIQVIDKNTGVYQFGEIQEPVIKNKEVENALLHFGINYASVEWKASYNNSKIGIVEGTTKIVTFIMI